MGDMKNKIVLITGASSGNTKTIYNIYCINHLKFRYYCNLLDKFLKGIFIWKKLFEILLAFFSAGHVEQRFFKSCLLTP